MGIFSRFRKKESEDDIDEIRSEVLGSEEPRTRNLSDKFSADDDAEPRLTDRPRELEPMGFERPGFGREPVEMDKPSKGGSYEIIDRLNFIENQLAAIKSQTETINERLKNLDLKMGRRY
jgi:hypothetical protein